MSRIQPFARVALVLLAARMVSSALSAAEIVPVAQERYVSAYVINPRCVPSSSFEEFYAPGFDPFSARAARELACGGALGVGANEQRSEINPAAILGVGHSRSQASSDTNITIHSIGGSYFDVTFTIDEPTTYELSGEVSAVRNGVIAQGASAGVSLRGPGDLLVYSQAVFAPADETESRATVAAGGPLAPGTYRLRANAQSVIDSGVPPNGGGQAAFAFRFDLPQRCPTDLNGDGLVDLDDLVLLLSQFGCSGAACLADIDGDEDIDLSDLAEMLSAFGAACP